MHRSGSVLTSVVVIIASLCLVGYAQDQEYIITGPADTQFIPNYGQNPNEYINPGRISPFRQSPQGFQQTDSYLPQRDLQTSDLPYHLQQTLPQYRITTQTPQYTLHQQYNFPNSPPAPFRAPNNQPIIPSTHRPNYSHLFSHTHNRNPLQTETFLGEITLQSPAELPTQFNGFKPSAFLPQYTSQNSPNPNGENTVKLENNPRSNFLNQRTRIFAPDDENQSNRKQVKNYFVNNNGEVFITTKTPPTSSTSLKSTQTKELKSKPKNLSTTPKNSFDLESLLEEPIQSHTNTKSDNVVEIVKSVSSEIKNNQTDYEDHDSSQEQATTDYEYELSSEYSTPTPTEYLDDEEDTQNEENKDGENDIDEYSYETSKELKTDSNSKEANKSFQVITTKPTTMVHEDNFNKFVDSSVIDSTVKQDMEDEAISSATESSYDVEENTEVIETENQNMNKTAANIPELVVSVVTTKSVINNTLIATGTPSPPVTERMIVNDENTTDTWVVVASVQTSRSVSGARYLPSSIVAQEERVKLLNENSQQKPEEEEEEDDEYEEIVTTLAPTTTKQKTSTESLIDKLDRVQSDLSSGLLSGGFKEGNTNFTVITENGDKVDSTTMFDISITSTETTTATSTTTKSPSSLVNIRKFSPNARPPLTQRPKKIFDNAKQDDLTGLLPPGYKPRYQNNRKSTSTTTSTTETSVDVNKPQGDAPVKENYATSLDNYNITVQNVSAFLPPNYKKSEQTYDSAKILDELMNKLKSQPKNESTENTTKTSKIELIKQDDIAAFLPPGYSANKAKDNDNNGNKIKNLFNHAKQDDIAALLPPGYKVSNDSKPKNATKHVFEISKQDDVASFLPPGYKSYSYRSKSTTTTTTRKPNSQVASILSKAKPVENLSSLLPSGYKPNTTSMRNVDKLLNQAKPVDINAFLPPGYKARTTEKPLTTPEEVPLSLLPPGYKIRESSKNKNGESTTAASTTSTSPNTTPKAGSGFKVVFPSRPGGGVRKSATRLTTPKASEVEETKATPPTIQRGWPSRATTEFTGWPTPSTTPISIEKLLEAARTASTSTTVSPEDLSSVTTTTTSTTVTTTTTPRPTTPGICVKECDLAGTIKLIGGATWAPELLDRNTKEWQILANEVQTELERVYSKSNLLSKWYKTIRIDGFSEGSILVDYLVELNDLGRQVDTIEIKKLFHDSLESALLDANSNREGKALNESVKPEEKLSLGNFIVDPKYTDFIVLPKELYPTVGYAEDNVLLPQWAIAVIVIGLASLLFVIIFGVTVLVNRQKNAKKKTPIPLTEDMLNELNKNHMGGFDNYGADDLYNMEDVWNDRGYDPKMAKKRSSGSIHDNSMSNLYDSWRSEWNGYYYNAYYGNNPGSSHGGYGRRRSDYDTNF